ncbi:DUF1330 domain-containing protein [uncultured Croceitalea sp.]|uniref:DUF1330 domain-containing protein n=1 Tax=uncultured Croceitalea sp. TaxID=1798908 RepID=UPI00330648CB
MNLKIILIIIALANPNEKEAFEHYISQIRAQYELVGAKPVKYPVNHVVMGEEKPDFIMVVEFPNQEALQKLFTSEDYKKLVPYREKAFTDLKVFLSKRE